MTLNETGSAVKFNLWVEVGLSWMWVSCRLQLVRTVSAGVAAASVDSLLTVGASEPGRAAAAVTAGGVLDAGSSIETRPVGARHGADLAVLAVEALRARTGVITLQILGGETKTKTWVQLIYNLLIGSMMFLQSFRKILGKAIRETTRTLWKLL